MHIVFYVDAGKTVTGLARANAAIEAWDSVAQKVRTAIGVYWDAYNEFLDESVIRDVVLELIVFGSANQNHIIQ